MHSDAEEVVSRVDVLLFDAEGNDADRLIVRLPALYQNVASFNIWVQDPPNSFGMLCIAITTISDDDEALTLHVMQTPLDSMIDGEVEAGIFSDRRQTHTLLEALPMADAEFPVALPVKHEFIDTIVLQGDEQLSVVLYFENQESSPEDKQIASGPAWQYNVTSGEWTNVTPDGPNEELKLSPVDRWRVVSGASRLNVGSLGG